MHFAPAVRDDCLLFENCVLCASDHQIWANLSVPASQESSSFIHRPVSEVRILQHDCSMMIKVVITMMMMMMMMMLMMMMMMMIVIIMFFIIIITIIQKHHEQQATACKRDPQLLNCAMDNFASPLPVHSSGSTSTALGA